MAIAAGDPAGYAQLHYTIGTRQREEIRFYVTADEASSPERAATEHPAAQPQEGREPDAWREEMASSFERWERAETSLDYEQGEDPAIAESHAWSDAARITPEQGEASETSSVWGPEQD
ncbi:MAG: hypothetical protein ACREPA_12640, partial [Candidatus Dormibacteraceae bacterium]